MDFGISECWLAVCLLDELDQQISFVDVNETCLQRVVYRGWMSRASGLTGIEEICCGQLTLCLLAAWGISSSASFRARGKQQMRI